MPWFPPYGLSAKQRKKQFEKKRKAESPAYKRKQELNSPKIQQAITMIKRARKHGFLAKYTLGDSWFFCYELLRAVIKGKNGGHFIGMAKMGPMKFSYKGQSYSPKQLNKLGHKPKRARALKAHYKSFEVHYGAVPLKVFLVCYSGQKQWQLMVTTDFSLSFKELMQLYSIRWGIEVLFKESKQYLQLGKCQSRDFDAQIADATISMLQYILLAYSKRFQAYESIGDLFKSQQAEVIELTLAERYWGLIQELINEICDVLEVSPEDLLEKLFSQDKKQSTVVKKLIQIVETEDGSNTKKAA